MDIDFYAVSQKHLTFLAEEGVAPGVFVKMSTNATVAPCSAGDTPIGICTSSEGDCASIQLEGHCKIVYTLPAETQVKLGYQNFVCSDSTTLKPDAAGRQVLVLSLGTENEKKIAEILL